jgi:type VI secretion system protein ImpJ
MDLSRLVWREGMYLGQHHFQLQQRYFEDSIRFAIEKLFFRPYGLVTCTFDEEALRSGVAALVQAQGLLPDVTPFSIPESDDAPRPLNLREAFPPGEHTQLLLLTLAPRAGENGNAAEAPRAANDRTARHRVLERVVRDESTGRGERRIEVGAKNLRLICERDARHGETVLPVARVRRLAADAFAFDAAYVPPLLSIGGSKTLMDLAQRLVDYLGAKVKAMADERRSSGAAMPEFAVSELTSFWLLNTIHESIATLQHLINGRDVHPEQLYVELARLAGALCTFTQGSHPRDVPPYDHDNLGSCFGALESMIRDRADRSQPTNFARFPLERASLTYTSRSTGKSASFEGYRVRLPDDRTFSRAQWVLGVRAKLPIALLVEQVPRQVKVCSASGVAFLVAHAQPGMELTHLPVPPATIASRADTQYFTITRAGKCEELLVASREMGVHVPHSIPDPSLELIVIYES